MSLLSGREKWFVERTKTTLSPKEVALQKDLIRAVGNLEELKDEVYKPLLECAGNTLGSQEAVTKLESVFDHYYRDESGRKPLVLDLRERGERFLEVLIDDPDSLREARRIWAEKYQTTPLWQHLDDPPKT